MSKKHPIRITTEAFELLQGHCRDTGETQIEAVSALILNQLGKPPISKDEIREIYRSHPWGGVHIV